MSPSLDELLAQMLSPQRAPPGIREAWGHVAEFALRPGKRVRPRLVSLGWQAAGGASPEPRGLVQFAAGLELMHAFFLVHDDIADCADTRRGGPALHRTLGGGRAGEQLAVVAGDLLFVEATDALLSCGLPNAVEATRAVLAICRDTAAGQFLDLTFAELPLEKVCPSSARRAELLKTARYTIEAPLVAGAMLAGGRAELLAALRRFAQPLGLAYQFRDDLLPFLREACDKPALADLAGGKKTWLIAIAWQSLDETGRAELQRCLRCDDPSALARARGLLMACGALTRAQDETARLCALARRQLAHPSLAAVRTDLEQLVCLIERLT
ncbi:MAG: polyprenyl synthetase family protein [Deltaproteobacteria bacterium]|nr:polyprenyl synthetase family protein [Deltaproteobacteria bacterium]